MRSIAALFFILFLAAGTAAWADWESGWGNEGVENTGKKPGNVPPDEAAREKPKEAIAGEPARDENAPVEMPGEAPTPPPVENSGSEKE